MSITLEEFQARLSDASDNGALKALVKKQLQRTVKTAERGAKLRVTGGNPLNTRSGRLRASIRSGVRGGHGTGARADLVGYLRAGGAGRKGHVKYARIHEKGGTIVPRNKQWLTIPMSPAKTAAGVARGSARSFRSLMFMPDSNNPERAYLVHAFSGALFFLLVKRVTIPARPYLRPSMEEASNRLPAALAPLLGQALKVDL